MCSGKQIFWMRMHRMNQVGGVVSGGQDLGCHSRARDANQRFKEHCAQNLVLLLHMCAICNVFESIVAKYRHKSKLFFFKSMLEISFSFRVYFIPSPRHGEACCFKGGSKASGS